MCCNKAITNSSSPRHNRSLCYTELTQYRYNTNALAQGKCASMLPSHIWHFCKVVANKRAFSYKYNFLKFGTGTIRIRFKSALSRFMMTAREQQETQEGSAVDETKRGSTTFSLSAPNCSSFLLCCPSEQCVWKNMKVQHGEQCRQQDKWHANTTYVYTQSFVLSSAL